MSANLIEQHPYTRPQYPLLIVIAGPSGVGKDTLARLLMARRPDSFYFVVTATTRPPRSEEEHGKDYFFVSNNEFAQMINDGELLEYAIVYNDFKGVPKQQIRDALASGKDVIMRVDVQGAATIRKLLPNAIYIFLSVESEESMVRRLRERRSESDQELMLRIATARHEMERVKEFDYFVVNYESQQEKAVNLMLSIMDAERSRIGRNPIKL